VGPISGGAELRPRGLNPDLLRRLRRGDWVVRAPRPASPRTQEEARGSPWAFLAAAKRRAGAACASSTAKAFVAESRAGAEGQGPEGLQQRDEVLAYCEPRPLRGSGAVVVLLSGAIDAVQNGDA
jgi:DNA-nicking Smr family endonuclease